MILDYIQTIFAQEGKMKEKKTPVAPEFPERLKALRKDRNWSQGQIAMKIGVDPQRISKYERGIIYPTTELALKIAELFEVSLDYLFYGNDNLSASGIKNKTLIKMMKEADSLPEKQQQTLIELLDAFIKKHKFEELMQNH